MDKKRECIVDKGIREAGLIPASFARMSGVSRQVLWRHKENPRLNWTIGKARMVVKALKLVGIEIDEMDLLTRSEQ